MSENELTPEQEEALNKLEVMEKSIKLLRKYGKVQRITIKKRDPFIPRNIEEEIRKNIKKMKVITANQLAQKYDVRVSSIKKLLKQLESEGMITRIASSSRIKIYKPA